MVLEFVASTVFAQVVITLRFIVFGTRGFSTDHG